ncbi:MAG: zinc ribbon domain-containing protein [bacterium]
MFCSNCGTKLIDDSKFCQSCGSSTKSSIEPNNNLKSSHQSFEKVKNFFSINTKTLPILGFLLFLLGIGSQTIHCAVAGIILFVGSAIYKSAKDRKLGTVKASFLRIFSEIIALLALVVILLFQPNARVVNQEEPLGFFILIWILTAYIYLHIAKYLGKNRKKKIAVAIVIFILIQLFLTFGPFYIFKI